MLWILVQTMWPTDFLTWALNLAYQSLRGPLKVRLYLNHSRKKLHVDWKKLGKGRDEPKYLDNRVLSLVHHFCSPSHHFLPETSEELNPAGQLGQTKHNQEDLFFWEWHWEPLCYTFLWAMGTRARGKAREKGTCAPLCFRSSDFACKRREKRPQNKNSKVMHKSIADSKLSTERCIAWLKYEKKCKARDQSQVPLYIC